MKNHDPFKMCVCILATVTTVMPVVVGQRCGPNTVGNVNSVRHGNPHQPQILAPPSVNVGVSVTTSPSFVLPPTTPAAARHGGPLDHSDSPPSYQEAISNDASMFPAYFPSYAHQGKPSIQYCHV